MDPYDMILTRRSIRTYTKQDIPEHVIHDLLDAAMSAPSAGNEQPWQFILINKRKLLDAIPRFHLHSQPIDIICYL